VFELLLKICARKRYEKIEVVGLFYENTPKNIEWYVSVHFHAGEITGAG